MENTIKTKTPWGNMVKSCEHIGKHGRICYEWRFVDNSPTYRGHYPNQTPFFEMIFAETKKTIIVPGFPSHA